MTKNFGKNEERTAEYLKQFNREKVLKRLINQNNPIIFDIGANNGSSLIEFKKWWPDSIIHCFEPQKECWEDLHTIQSEHENDSIVINKFALGDSDTDAKEFFTHDLNSGISGFNKINLKSKDSIDISTIQNDKNKIKQHSETINHSREVRLMRLDSYVSKVSLNNHIRLMKIDTQGYEPEILKGAGDFLKNVDIVLTELMFYDYYERSLSFSDIERYLHPADLRLYDISHIAKNPMNGRTDWVDVIYVNKRVI